MRELNRKQTEAILNSFPKGVEFKGVHTHVMTQSGNYGWQSDYSVNGKPVIRIVTDNAHQFSRVYDIRNEVTPALAPEAYTTVHG